MHTEELDSLRGFPSEIARFDPDYFHELIAYDELARCGSGGFMWGISGGMTIGYPPVRAGKAVGAGKHLQPGEPIFHLVCVLDSRVRSEVMIGRSLAITCQRLRLVLGSVRYSNTLSKLLHHNSKI